MYLLMIGTYIYGGAKNDCELMMKLYSRGTGGI